MCLLYSPVSQDKATVLIRWKWWTRCLL